MTKRTLALVLALVMCLGILAGCEQKPAETSKPAETTKPVETTAPTETTAAPTEPAPTEYTFPAGAKLDIYPQDSSSQLTAHVLTGFIEDATGLVIEWKGLPSDGGIVALLTDDVTPSLVASSHTSIVNEYGRYGAFINLWDYQDIMPNFFAEMLSDERADYRATYMPSENELYCAPIFVDVNTGVPSFMVRGDIMEELKLEVPTDWDSFYAVLKAMKAAYPDSYPFTCRQMSGTLTQLQHLAPLFGVNFHVAGLTNSCLRLDRETGKYYEALATDGAREMLKKLRLMVEEGLMDPACLAYDTAGWVESMASGHAFITLDTVFNFDAIQNAGVVVDEDFELTYWPVFSMGDYDLYPVKKPGVPLNNWAITTRCADVELACRFLDWWYTDEAKEIMSWGAENVTFTVDAEGNKSFIEGADITPLASTGRGGIIDPAATLQTYSKTAQNMLIDAFAVASASDYIQDPLLVYDATGQLAWDTYAVGYSNVRATYVQKFILGQEDINNDATWQKYLDDLAAQGQADQIAAAEAAYAAMQG